MFKALLLYLDHGVMIPHMILSSSLPRAGNGHQDVGNILVSKIRYNI